MKKIISLIASIAMLATMVTSVSAAELANNKPVVDSVITELSAEEFENDWIGAPLEDGQKAYLVNVNVSGLDLSNVAPGTTNLLKKKRTGVLLMLASYKLNIDSMDNVVGIWSTDGLGTATTEENVAYSILQYNNAPSAYPTTTDGNTTPVTATDLEFLYQYIIAVKGEVVATPYSQLKISSFEKDAQTGTLNFGASEAQQASYTVNGEAATTITFGAVAPDPDPEPDPDPVEEFEYRAKKDLKDGDTVIGYAWDLTINGFDSTKTYTATFTAGGETKTNELFLDGAEVKNGSIAFAALLKTAKTAVELVLAKN